MRLRTGALLMALAAAHQGALSQQPQKFPDHGFKITPPVNWTLIPPRPGEQWILAHFMGDREYTCKSGVNDAATVTHRPRLRVFGFPKRDSPVEIETVKETETRSKTTFRYPYRNYADYLKRHDHGGGYFVASSSELTLGGFAATKQEVKIEKLASAPRRLLVCIYHLPDRDLAVEVEILESVAGDLSEEMYRSIKSLVVTGEAKKPESAPSRTEVTISVDESSKDAMKRRDERRRAWKEREIAEVQKGLPKGWTSRKTKHFLILSHASDRYTELIVWQANEVRDWLDDNFKGVGEGEVMRSIIRICASGDEARAYSSGSGDSFVFESGEVVCAEREGSILGDFSEVASALLDQYLADRNPALDGALPTWLQVGLNGHVSSARISKKQSGLVFPPPTSELRTCMKMLSENRLMPLDQLVRTEPDVGSDDRKSWDATGEFMAESELFVRFLLVGPGKTGRTKGLIQRYMQGTAQQLDSLDLDAWKKNAETRLTKAPTTEAEEEEEFQRRRKEGKEFAKKHRAERMKILDELTGIALKDWKPEDWTRLNKSFESWLKNNMK